MPYRLNEAIENKLIEWAGTQTGITFIWDKQEAERPSLPYGTLNILTGANIEVEPSSNYKELDTFTKTFRKTFIISVNIYADDMYLTYLDNLKESTYLGSVKLDLESVGVVCRSVETIIDLSELVDTKYEFRCQADFNMAYVTERDVVSGEIQRVSGPFRLVDADGTETTINYDTNNV